MPPVGKWQYAAVFDDSIVRTAAWSRTQHAPPNANDAQRKPYSNGLRLTLTMAGQNMRGELGYGSVGVSGTMFHEESPYSWGIDGDRQKCPAPQDVHSS
jgi:hypothetical protein